MDDRKRRLLWTIAAIVLPGPWTPVIVLLYVLRRAQERTWEIDDSQLIPHPASEPTSSAGEQAGGARGQVRRHGATGSLSSSTAQCAPEGNR
jgi:hypothetical protein